MSNVVSPKKLIEVALPLDAINKAAAREKSIRHGHPSTLHLWWARRPLAAARAVIFAQLVHDPEDLWRCQNPGVEPNAQHKGAWTKRRADLFALIERLVQWENTTNEAVLEPAREEIRRAWRQTCELNRNHPEASTLFDPDKMPGLHDPFAGGGTIPLEAQRLGLEAHASDLNPVAVLINKAMIEIPPKFADRPPIHPDAPKSLTGWKGAAGLAEDVRLYGKWMRDEAFKRIGHLYPPVEVTSSMAQDRPDLARYVGQKLTVIAWIWARTVKSPNPAFAHIDVPLASTFVLSSKAGKEAYIHPVVEPNGYTFTVRVGKPPDEAKRGTTAGKRAAFRCLMSNAPINYEYIKSSGMASNVGSRLLAIVAEGVQERVFIPPADAHELTSGAAKVSWMPEVSFLPQALGFRIGGYGMTEWKDLFSVRQLVALNTFSELIGSVESPSPNSFELEIVGNSRLSSNEFESYTNALRVYLSLLTTKSADYWSNLCKWRSDPKNLGIGHVFSSHILSMTWDFAECNPFSNSSGSWLVSVNWMAKAIENLLVLPAGCAIQHEAQSVNYKNFPVVSTDPPYYANVGYADLSDFFYVWLRKALAPIMGDLFSTISVPKAEELVATPARHGGKKNAELFFLEGMMRSMKNIAKHAQQSAPITIYYAFKEADTEDNGTNSTGWETFLSAVVASGLALTGTWPVRTEMGNRTRSMNSNALASSVVLVCRLRPRNAGTISRRQFVRQLNEALPLALDAMTRASEGKSSPVAPVDLSQAIIGPGMAIFSRYDAVLEADGTPMTVRTALQLINRFLAEDDFDGDTQFCLHWFEQHGWEPGKFGEADVLARAKGTSVDGVHAAGVIERGGGVVRLLRWREYAADWDPRTDTRLPVWEALHHLIRAHHAEGDAGAARVLAAVAGKAEAARQLAYRLYTLCERAGRAEDARAYNEVVTGWTGIEAAAATSAIPHARQGTLFGEDTP